MVPTHRRPPDRHEEQALAVGQPALGGRHRGHRPGRHPGRRAGRRSSGSTSTAGWPSSTRPTRPVNQAQLDTIVTILNDRVSAGASGATVASQGKNQISVSIPGEKNTQQILATLGNTAQLFFRPALCYATAAHRGQGEAAVDRAAARPARPATPADRGQPPGHAQLEQRQRLHQQHQHPRGPGSFATYKSTSPLSDNKADTVLLPGTAPSGSAVRDACSGPAQHDRHRGQVGQRPAQQRAVGGQPGPHRPGLHRSGTPWPSSSSTPSSPSTSTARSSRPRSPSPTQASFTSFNGQVQISGGFTEDQAKTLATEFTYGALPVKLDRLTVQTVSPVAGQVLAAGRPHLRPGRPGPGAALHHLLLPAARDRGGGRPGRDRRACCGPSSPSWARRSTPPSTWPASSASSCRSVSPSTPTSSTSND